MIDFEKRIKDIVAEGAVGITPLLCGDEYDNYDDYHQAKAAAAAAGYGVDTDDEGDLHLLPKEN